MRDAVSNRSCLTAGDARMLSAEIRLAIRHIDAGRTADARRCLDQTADMLEKWTQKVTMRRDPVPPTHKDANTIRLPPDPAWQSTNYARKLRDAQNKERRNAGAE